MSVVEDITLDILQFQFVARYRYVVCLFFRLPANTHGLISGW